MIRKLLLPLVAVALLGGCVTSGYSYRQGSGDYYYGAPSVEYRYHTPYGYGYPYGYYGYGGSAHGYRHASPYRYRQYHHDPYRHYYYDPYRHHYYGYPYRQPNYYDRRPAPGPAVDPTPDRPRSPWRDLNRLGRRGMGDGGDATGFPGTAPRIEGDAGPERALRRRPSAVDTGDLTRPHAPAPLSPQPDAGAAHRGDGSALGGMVRGASRKGDPTDETTP